MPKANSMSLNSSINGDRSLSIIIVNWNSVSYLKSCLESVYSGSAYSQYEVIVVDNASFDGSDKYLAMHYPQVKFYQLPVNVGFSGANNFAYSNSSGKTLLFLNPDTEVIGDSIANMLGILWETSSAGAIGCTLLNSDGTLQTSCLQSFPTIVNQVLDANALRRLFPSLSMWGNKFLNEDISRPVSVDVVSGACLMLKRHVFEEAGQFSNEFFMYAEDTDLCCKVHKLGYQVYYTQRGKIIHHGGGSSKQSERSHFADVVMRESLFRFVKKYHGKAYCNIYRFAICGAAVVRILLLGAAILLLPAQSMHRSLRISFCKWVKVFRWSIGCEQWSKKLIRENPFLDKG